MSADSYGTSDAGRLLGVSPRRVRQLVDAGQLVAVSRDPLRVDARSLLELRETRRAEHPAAETAPSAVTETVAAVLDRALAAVQSAAERSESVYRERLAIADRTESDLREALAAERARADQLAAQLEQLRAELEPQGRKGKRRGKRRK